MIMHIYYHLDVIIKHTTNTYKHSPGKSDVVAS